MAKLTASPGAADRQTASVAPPKADGVGAARVKETAKTAAGRRLGSGPARRGRRPADAAGVGVRAGGSTRTTGGRVGSTRAGWIRTGRQAGRRAGRPLRRRRVLRPWPTPVAAWQASSGPAPAGRRREERTLAGPFQVLRPYPAEHHRRLVGVTPTRYRSARPGTATACNRRTSSATPGQQRELLRRRPGACGQGSRHQQAAQLVGDRAGQDLFRRLCLGNRERTLRSPGRPRRQGHGQHVPQLGSSAAGDERPVRLGRGQGIGAGGMQPRVSARPTASPPPSWAARRNGSSSPSAGVAASLRPL